MKFLYLASLFSLGLITAAEAYTPLTISSGFNADVIANGVGAANVVTNSDVDGVNYAYVSNGWQATASSPLTTTGLPATGLINSAIIPGLSFQLASYSANNDLRLATNTSGTLTVGTPMAAQNLYLLAITGSGSSTMTVQVNFTDATNQVTTGIAVADWYGGASVALTGFQRVNRTNNLLDNGPAGPNLYQYTIPILAANQGKLIASIMITRTAAVGAQATLNVFAASIQESASITCPAPTAPTATGITTTTASLNWTQAGTPAQWQIKYGAPGFNVSTGGTSIFTSTKPYTLNPPLTIATTYDYYVRAICAPGDTSAWSAVTTFTTACNAPTVDSLIDSFSCGPGTVQLRAVASSGGSIKWYAAATGGTALATGNIYTTPSLTTNTTYYVAAALGTCESSPRQAITAQIRPIPQVNLGNDTTICPGVAYTFDAGNPGAVYEWNTNQTTQTITKNAAGTYSVLVTLNGCSSSDAINITPGIVPVNNLAPMVNLCDGETATLNAGNSGSTFHWLPGNETTQVINVTTGGMRSVTIRSIHGCEIVSNSNIVMRPLPVAVLGNDTSICEGAQITLDAGNTGYNFDWNTGATTQSIDVSDSGDYSVTITSDYDCVISDDIHVSFLPSPRTEGFNFIPLFHDELGKVKFFVLNPTYVTGYEWDFGDNTPKSTLANPTHTYATEGNYLVTLKVINDCTDYSIGLDIHVNLSTGVVTLSKETADLSIYPNPGRDLVTVRNNSTNIQMKSVTIYNIVGAQVYHSAHISGEQHSVSVSSLPAGIYSVRIVTDKGQMIKKLEVLR